MNLMICEKCGSKNRIPKGEVSVCECCGTQYLNEVARKNTQKCVAEVRQTVAKKPIWYQNTLLILTACIISGSILTACATTPSPSPSSEPSSYSANNNSSSTVASSSDSSSKTASNSLDLIANVDAKEWPDVAELKLTYGELLEIYHEFEDSLDNEPDDYDEAMVYEEKMRERIGAKHGITSNQASLVYGYVSLNYAQIVSGSSAQPSYTVPYGTFISSTVNGSTIVIKAKITSASSNEAAIHENYYNVCDLIQNQGLDIFDEVQYWAIANTTSGKEAKIISFTVPKSLISEIATGKFAANTLGDYVDDLWILPSLLE